VFVVMIAIVARLAIDARARAPSAELAELHGAAGGVRTVALVAIALSVVTGVAAAALGRADTSTRGILVRLRDGTLITRHNPRPVVLAERVKRGPIVDRNGVPLATSPTSDKREYPLGAALGTLLGVSRAKVLLPPWALERIFDLKLRGYANLDRFVPLIDLDDA